MSPGFLAHVGVRLQAGEPGSAACSLRVGPPHLNPGSRLHGAVVMTLHEAAMAQALRAAAPPAPGARVLPLSSHYEFLAAAQPGEEVTARARVTRASRTVVFIDSELTGPQGLLSTARGLYGLTSAPPGEAVPSALPAGHVRSPSPADAFSRHAGPLYEKPCEGARSFGAVELLPHHDSPGAFGGPLDLLRLLGDVCLGRAAERASGGRPEVTLALTFQYLGELRVGDVVAATATACGVTPLGAALTGEFHVGDRLVATASGAWKYIGTR